MHIDYHKSFRKHYRKLPAKLQDRFDERLKVFIADQNAPELNNHTLHSEYVECRSINVTGDLHAIYEILKDGVRFIAIDTHSNLY